MIKEIWSIVVKRCGVSSFGVNGGPKKLIKVVIVGKKLISCTLSSQGATREHVRQVLWLALVFIVNGSVIFIFNAKTQQPRECRVVNGSLIALGGPCDGAFMRVKVVGVMKLSQKSPCSNCSESP